MPDALVVLHDYFQAAEGGGRLSLVLAEATGADLACGFRTADARLLGSYGVPACRALGGPLHWPPWRSLVLAHRFQYASGFVRDYATALYSGSYAPLAVLRHGARRNLLYCHTPPRFLYDQRDYFLGRLPAGQRPLARALVAYLRHRYEAAVGRMDAVVANSRCVRDRVRRYLSREATVIHPPCETRRFRWRGQADYYLSVARLDPLKRVDLCIRAFRKLPHLRLVVASGGTEAARLRRLAGDAPNIRFTGWLSEERMAQLLGEAVAVLYLPREEDFGMSAVEAMAAGKPVIGVAEGGLLETVVDGETGLLLPGDPTPEQVAHAVSRLTPARALALRYGCEQRAERFSRERFVARMRDLLEGG